MARSGTAQAAPTLAAAVKPIIQNTMLVPATGAVARIIKLMAPFPKWNSDSFRPARRAKRAGPTIPSDIAARHGPIVVPASPPITPAAATGQKRGASGMSRHVAVTTTTAPASSARFARSASTMAYGLPHDLDIWSPRFLDRFAAFCAAVARIVRDEGGAVPFYCPANEISFWAWAGGDHARMHPNSFGRGPELKRQLARAVIRAIEAVREVAPDARFVQAEPLIHVAGHPDMPETVAGAEAHRLAQFEAFDMIAGRLAPELGGSEAHLDIVGVNFYPENQLIRGGTTLPLGHWLYRPLRHLLAEVDARYGRPVLLSETGAEGSNGAGWLRHVGGEVCAARRAGVPVQGICLYPVMNYPGWQNDRLCQCGLIRSGGDWRERSCDQDLMDQVAEEQMLLAMAGAAGA